jgi:hypothetical protein
MGQSNVSMTAAISAVRSLLDEPNPQFWSNAEIGLWLNEACVDVQRRCEILRQKAGLVVASNAQDIAAPTDTMRIYRMEFVPTGQTTLTYPMEFRGYLNMDSVWGNLQSLPSAWPEYYTLWYSPVGANESGAPTPTQLTIRLFPVPAQAGTLNCFYYRLPVAALVTPGTDTLDIVPGWEDACYDYACYRALRKDSDPRWNDQFQIYQEKLMDLMSRTHPDWTDQPDYFGTGAQGIPSWLVGSEW